ncbi:hypothetical protein ANCCEY_03186 [Ancylostoma ceylanicum]|uniref:Uncharacterized protein n=1 Tax=Ancylostoma ceylanicum TaxID=53326 RepID=A0A0D6MBE9_9BILA|nr:hypothetical protein ANCCEY_03186 [Ancylostoma ceylanicum]
MDVFCGTLTVFEQQRFGTNSIALSSQETSDLKQCLELCCSVMTRASAFFVTVVKVIVEDLGQGILAWKCTCVVNGDLIVAVMRYLTTLA